MKKNEMESEARLKMSHEQLIKDQQKIKEQMEQARLKAMENK